MNEIKIFENAEFGKVRIVEVDGEPWLVGKDVAEALGYSNPSKALSDHVDEEDKLNNESLSSLGQRGGWIINESGLYSLVLSSQLPTAKKFKQWITAEVIPSIRKHGAYMNEETIEKTLTNPDFIIKLATKLKEEKERARKLEYKIEEDTPKVLFADSVSASETSILIGELAKILKQNGIDIDQNRLFAWLREHKYLISRCGTDYNMPTQRAMDLGLFTIKETTVNHADGHTSVNKTPKVTGKGLIYFVGRFLGKKPAIRVL